MEEGGRFDLGSQDNPMMEKATIYIKDPLDPNQGIEYGWTKSPAFSDRQYSAKYLISYILYPA